MSVIEALLHTALWTRPPVVRGFELSDMWAWLRYFPAIDDRPELCLRREWSEVDAHQKTILSDEVGVGFTTCVLAQHLQLAEFVDTHHALRVLFHGEFRLRAGPGRRGPRKAPDYLARTPTGGVVVLECKGAQSSPAALEKAMRDGIAQKKNITACGNTAIEMGLVGGLFIPQTSSRKMPCLLFADPEWDWLGEGLARVPQGLLDLAIRQVLLAKVLAILDEPRVANALMQTSVEAIHEGKAKGDLWRLKLHEDDVAVRGSLVVMTRSGDPSRAKLSVGLPMPLVEAMANGDIRRAIDAIGRQETWRRRVEDHAVSLVTPHGIRLQLQVG